MHSETARIYEDEINLREVVRALLSHWKIIVVVALLGGVVGLGLSLREQPQYQANARVLIPQVLIPQVITAQGIYAAVPTTNETDLSALLMSNPVRQKAAEKLGVSPDTLPKGSVSISANRTITTLYTITAVGRTPAQAAQLANAWAEASLDYVNQWAQVSASQEDKTRTALQDAQRALLSYLRNNHLDQLTWTDLQALTGAGLAQSTTLPADAPGMPAVSSDQRLQIASLMQTQLDAQAEYNYVHTQAYQIRYALASNPPVVQSSASAPRSPASPNTLINTALGIVAGVVLVILWVFVRDWWQSSPAGKQEKREQYAKEPEQRVAVP